MLAMIYKLLGVEPPPSPCGDPEKLVTKLRAPRRMCR
jgi:hypothetical protein